MVLDIIENILFGSGAYIGFFIVITFAFLLIILYKYLGIVSVVLTFYFGYRYYELYNSGSGSWLLVLWGLAWICCFIEVVFMLKRKE